MAFNPFTTFRKYQKYWMAGAVLVCMMTFVLCSGGIRGTGLDDLFMKWFGRRHGDVLVTVKGRKYYYEDLNTIKNQRNIAKDYMRELTNTAINRIQARIKQMKSDDRATKDEQYQLVMGLCQKCLGDLLAKVSRDPGYFHGGTKLEDLVDFILWRDQADQYGINLTDEVVGKFVDYACHGIFWQFDNDTSREVQEKVRASHYDANETTIRDAIKQEFRVQIAQLAAMARWSPGYQQAWEKLPERDLYADIQTPNGTFAHVYLNTPLQMRIAPTVEEICAHYRKMRSELSFDLLPVSLEVLANEVKLPADAKARLEALKKFYDEYAKKEYNPNLDTPGFTLPARAEIQMLRADNSMDYYKQPAQVASVLRKTPPVAYNPMSQLAGALSFLSTPPAWDASLQRNLDAERNKVKDMWNEYYMALARRYEQYLNETNEKMKENIKLAYDINLNRPPPPYKNSASPWTTPLYYSPGQYQEALEKPNAETVAALLGGVNADPWVGLVAYEAGAYQAQAKKIQPLIAFDKTQRTQVGAELFLAQTPPLFGGGAFTAAGLTYYASLKPQFLPVAGYIEKELQSKIEERQAQVWVNRTMLDVKKKLEAVKGRDFAFRDQVEKLKAYYSRDEIDKDGKKKTVSGLLFAETAYPRSEYDVEFDEDLKPLLRGFERDRIVINLIEGRSGKPDMLREGDFAKLFFGSERLGFNQSSTFMPKIWPPYVTAPQWQQKQLAEKSLEQRLFDDAEKPIVFWKSAERKKEPMEWRPDDPKMLAFVEKQYRLDKARAKFMDDLKIIVDAIDKAQRSEGRDMATTFRELAKKQGVSVITLNKVAMMVENPDRKTAETMPFVDYLLPRETIPFARADMVKQLLSLRSLTSVLKTDVEDTDKQNKTPAGEAAIKRARTDLAELDKLNEVLFRKDLVNNFKGKVRGQVQVLTNKPRSIYYIALVTDYVEPSLSDTLAKALQRDAMQNSFSDQIQIEQGKELLKMFSEAWRKNTDLVTITAEARKQFSDESQ